ncbi:hypothetical protein F0562_013499 [Nyssa sinensis]|uniref:Uncharacterized protein n=1 Tax=Nyssa sinensis TaxID=561372 RepID=A0A5J4ZKE1_9ASTE|nr:hypothetical protein F0562_013499 [Nyssa sinensis]
MRWKVKRENGEGDEAEGGSGTKDKSVAGGNNDMENKDKNNIWMASSSVARVNPMPSVVAQPIGSLNSPTAKTRCSATKGLGLCGADDFYRDFSMADVDSSLESYEELFGVSQNQSKQFFENGGIDCLFGIGDMPGTDIKTRCAYTAELIDFKQIEQSMTMR